MIEKITRENITDADIDFLNHLRLGILPDFDLAGKSAGENHRADINRAREMGQSLAYSLIGPNALEWNIEDFSQLGRSLEKLKEITATMGVIYSAVQRQVSPKQILGGEKVVPVKKYDKSGKPLNAAAGAPEPVEIKPREPKPAGRPKLSPEEKSADFYRSIGLPPASIALALKPQFPDLTEDRINEVAGYVPA
jgi:hypothetical protein